MLGLLVYREPGSNAPPFRVIGGTRFRVVYATPGEGLRARLSARAAARTLAREGVREAVLPPDYAYDAYFVKYGIFRPPLAPLYRATAAAIARRYMAQRHIGAQHATIAFAAASVTPELRDAAKALCADVRYLALSVSRGGEELARSLKRKHGVAARLITPNEPICADLIVDLDGGTTGEGILRLNEELRVTYESELPNELLAALWRAGALDAGKLAVRQVDIT